MTAVHAFPSTQDLSKALDQYVEKLSAESIKKHGRFMLAISGGSLPKLLSANLKHNPRIDFSKWHIFFADERCVPLDHEDSNYLEVKNQLLDALAEQIQPGSVHTINPDLSPVDAAEEYMDQLRHVFAAANAVKFPVFDLILLGMGKCVIYHIQVKS
jgi:6-phosphogluconolactonase